MNQSPTTTTTPKAKLRGWKLALGVLAGNIVGQIAFSGNLAAGVGIGVLAAALVLVMENFVFNPKG